MVPTDQQRCMKPPHLRQHGARLQPEEECLVRDGGLARAAAAVADAARSRRRGDDYTMCSSDLQIFSEFSVITVKGRVASELTHPLLYASFHRYGPTPAGEFHGRDCMAAEVGPSRRRAARANRRQLDAPSIMARVPVLGPLGVGGSAPPGLDNKWAAKQ